MPKVTFPDFMRRVKLPATVRPIFDALPRVTKTLRPFKAPPGPGPLQSPLTTAGPTLTDAERAAFNRVNTDKQLAETLWYASMQANPELFAFPTSFKVEVIFDPNQPLAAYKVYGINDNGDIVGSRDHEAFYRMHGGAPVFFGVRPPGVDTVLTGISKAGLAVGFYVDATGTAGSYAFTYDCRTASRADRTKSAALRGMNNEQHAAGGGMRAGACSGGGVVADLSDSSGSHDVQVTCSQRAGHSTHLYGISDVSLNDYVGANGVIVGQREDTGNITRGFVYAFGDYKLLKTTLADTDVVDPGFLPMGVNDFGAVVGSGPYIGRCLQPYMSAFGRVKGYRPQDVFGGGSGCDHAVSMGFCGINRQFQIVGWFREWDQKSPDTAPVVNPNRPVRGFVATPVW